MLRHIVNQPSTGSYVSLKLETLGTLSTSSIQLPLSELQTCAWRTRIVSLQDTGAYPGPFVVVDISKNVEEGLSVMISPLLRIHNETKFSLELSFERPQQEEAESVSLFLKSKDTIDDCIAAFEAVNLSGGAKKALMSLSVGNFLFSFRPDDSKGTLSNSNNRISVGWSDKIEGGKAIRLSGIIDKLGYKVRKALNAQSSKCSFSLTSCSVTSGDSHLDTMHFLVQSIIRDVPVMKPNNGAQSSSTVTFIKQKEFFLLPTVRIFNLLQLDVHVLLIESDELKQSENKGNQATVPCGSTAELYANPSVMCFTITLVAFGSSCKPVKSGDWIKKLNKQKDGIQFLDIDLEFFGGKYFASLRLTRDDRGILEAVIFTQYTLKNNTGFPLFCSALNQKPISRDEIQSFGSITPPHLGSFLPPQSSRSWFMKSNILCVTLLDEESSPVTLDLDSLSGLTEISLVKRLKLRHLLKLGVSLGPLGSTTSAPAEVVSMIPRYVVSNNSNEKKEFNGYTEEGVTRTPLTGSQVYERIKNVDTKYGKGFKSVSAKGVLWKKVSILWDLPYWKDLSVRHCLDVMHIEKNVCDAIIGTLLNIPGKTKDNQKVRFDMKERNIRPDLWPVVKPDGKKTFLPPACYTMSRKEKKVFCECLHGIKVPSGYSSNVKRLVSLSDLRLIGMKSHDCHVLINVFLPIALRGILPKHVRHVITKLCVFFNSICAKVIDPKILDALHVDIVETLCRFEMYFPPSFFDIMVHLIVHLVREIKLCGPVYLRWMYPFERFFGSLKDKVKNRANPEGSIIRGVLHEEISQYAAEFLSRLHPIGLPKSRHAGRLEGEGVIGKNVISPPSERKIKAHLCVLQHLTEVNPYIEKHCLELLYRNPKLNERALMREHNRSFVEWFKKEVAEELRKGHDVSDTVKWLSRGPRLSVWQYEGYDINGFTFYTRRQDEKSVVQNSGVKVVASSRVYASAKDKRPVDATQSYYGVIEEIWELDYNNFTIPVFRCKWVNNTNGVKQR